MSILPPGSDSNKTRPSERRADAAAIGCYYEFVTDVDDPDEDDTYHPRWSQLTEEDREGWRRVAAYVGRVEKMAYEDGRASIQPIAYTIVERHVSGPMRGRLDNDWDGEIHESVEVAKAELAEANRPDSDDPTQTPSDHWKLYALIPVGDA